MTKNSYRNQPDERGHFGPYGGRYVAETLMPLILDVEKAWNTAKNDPAFWAQYDELAKHYVGRPSPLYFGEKTTKHFGGAKIYFKRDELNHTGAHKINHCIGQQSARCSIFPARYSWAQRMWSANHRMFSA
jgi:tryptophan synthase beta chain